MSLLHPPGAGQQAGADQRRWPSPIQAEDPFARRRDACGHVATGVHAAASVAGDQSEAAPHSVPRHPGAQRQASRVGGAGRVIGLASDAAST